MLRHDVLQAGPLVIPRVELVYRATRAGGPGGQHVNTASTRVELWWNLETSSAPSATQRTLLHERLHSRLDRKGWLRLTEAGRRSQLRNREVVTERFTKLVARAVIPPKPRRRTRVPRAEKRRRLEAKRHRGELKRRRGRVVEQD